MMARRHRILILLGSLADDASGATTSFRALSRLMDDCDFLVFANRGFNPVEGNPPMLHGRLTFLLRSALRESSHDLLIMNSFFDRRLTIPTILMRRAGLVPKVPVILSPRGEFGAGALSLKSRRKRAWIDAVRRGRLLRDVWLHATEEHEREDLERADLRAKGILFAQNVRAMFEQPTYLPRRESEPLRIALVGRITPVKNILFAIETLAKVSSPAQLDIYGPLADRDYWQRCEQAIAKLPSHVTARHGGEVPNAELPEILAAHDLFFLPTLGENFGHAINEALMSGTPALISDKTPWRDLPANHAGWDLPLDAHEPFAKAIDDIAAMGSEDYLPLRSGARALAERRHAESDAIEAHRRMFEMAMTAS